jgi:hypothetical protein
MRKTFWLIPLLLALPALAAIPQFWQVRTYDEFRRGELNGLSVTSDGELVLAPRIDMLFDTEEPLIFSAVTDSAGNVYLGTGHEGKVYRVDREGSGSVLLDLGELDVLALAISDEDVLFAATSPDGEVYRVGPDGSAESFFDPEAKYIWSMVFAETGDLLVATGDEGVIYRVGADGQGEVFYDSDETHIIAMAMDADGNVIAGGDPRGYVYRISADGKPFVLYDSGMREVHSVSVAADGTIYAGVLSGSGGSIPTASPATSDASGAGTSTVSITVGASASVPRAQSPSPGQQAQSTVISNGSGAGLPLGGSRSAIIEIRPDQSVTSIWQSSSEMVFSVLPQPDRLLFSTGTKGRIYSYEGPVRTTLLVESTEEQTTRLLAFDGGILATTSNSGKLFLLRPESADSGSYESIVRNTGATSSWGKVTWKGGADGVEILTRSGNTGTPDQTWSDWSSTDDDGSVSSPKARFIQWKAILEPGNNSSPVLSSVTVPYLQQNFRPLVTTLTVLPSSVALQKIQTVNNAAPSANGGVGGSVRAIPPRRTLQKGAQSLEWTATDRNNDGLVYAIHYKAENEGTWKLLVEGVEDPFYTIDSDSLPDGTYVIRVEASDEGSNPAAVTLSGRKETAPFAIDNTPPRLTVRDDGIESRRVSIHVDAADQTSTLKRAEISIDAGGWRPVFPMDGIIDSKSEVFEFQSVELESGEHTIAFRVYDQNENVGMGKTIVRIP